MGWALAEKQVPPTPLGVADLGQFVPVTGDWFSGMKRRLCQMPSTKKAASVEAAKSAIKGGATITNKTNTDETYAEIKNGTKKGAPMQALPLCSDL